MKMVTVEQGQALQLSCDRRDLESGNIIFFPKTPFDFPAESRDFLRSLRFAGKAVHKNIAYRTQSDRVTGVDPKSAEAAKLHDVMRQYSQSVVRFVSELLPEYALKWKLDYASFRPVEEHRRDLPLTKRNDLLHTDAFPSRPTNGSLILRVFTNIHPTKKRVWVTSDPFEVLATRYALEAGLERIAAGASSTGGKLRNQFATLLHGWGLPIVPRSAYDRFMLRFHDYLKRNRDFQENTPKYEFEFPAGSTWLCFTDIVPHSVKSGQHAVEQTFLVARESLADLRHAPISILERICGKQLSA